MCSALEQRSAVDGGSCHTKVIALLGLPWCRKCGVLWGCLNFSIVVRGFVGVCTQFSNAVSLSYPLLESKTVFLVQRGIFQWFENGLYFDENSRISVLISSVIESSGIENGWHYKVSFWEEEV